MHKADDDAESALDTEELHLSMIHAITVKDDHLCPGNALRLHVAKIIPACS